MFAVRDNAGKRFAARVLVCAVGVAVVFGMCAWGQGAPTPTLKIVAQKTTGEVVRSHFLIEKNIPAPGEEQQTLPPISSQSMSSDDDETHEYIITNPAPGRYTISWSEGGEGLVSAMPPISVNVQRGGAPINLVFKVKDGGVIAGRVTDAATQQPLAGIRLTAHPVTAEGTSRSGETDVDGRYRIVGALEGTYTVYVGSSQEAGYVPVDKASERQAETAPGKTAEGIDFVMRKVPLMRGRAVDADGNPVAGGVSAIATLPKRQERRANNATERDGSFVLSGLEPGGGVYVGFESLKEGRGLCAVPIGPFTLTEQGLDGLVVVAQEAGQVSGVVLDSLGNPLPDAMVELASIAHKGWEYSARSDALGVFVFKGVYAGDFLASAIVVSLDKGSGLHFETEAPVACTVRPGAQVTGLKLTVPRDTGFIAGTVRDAAGKPIEGAVLSVLRPHQDCVLGEPDTFATDKEGRYRITGLAAGDWAVFVRDTAERYRPTSRTPVAVGSTDVDFTLHEACFVEGRVVSAETGQALPEFQVSLITRRYEEPLDGYRGGVPFKDAEGRFKLLMDFEGTMDITLVAYGPGYAAEKTFVSAVSPDKALTDVVVKLHCSGIVRGAVLGPDGKPKPGVKIVRGELTIVHEWDLFHTVAETAQDGTFESKDLIPGAQVLSAYSPDCAPARIEVLPKSGETETVEFRLMKGAAVEGNISVGGAPVDSTYEVRIELGKEGGARPLGGEGVKRGMSHYSFEHPLAPGSFWIAAEFRGESTFHGRVQREVTLKDGVPAQMDFDLPAGKCALAGTLSAPEGAKGAWIGLEIPVEGGMAVLTRWIDPGAYRFEGLPEFAGEVKVETFLSFDKTVLRKVPVKLVAGTPCRLDVDVR